MSKGKIAGIAVAVVLVAGIVGWISTAPYLSNEGLGRTPGVIIGGTLTEAPSDFAPLQAQHQGPIMMKQTGFPPLVIYLSWVGTPDGIITATRPDGGYWAQRIRDRGGDGLIRIGDETYEMTATEIFGEDRLDMMRQWGGGRPLDQPAYPGAEPLGDWEVFFWTAR